MTEWLSPVGKIKLQNDIGTGRTMYYSALDLASTLNFLRHARRFVSEAGKNGGVVVEDDYTALLKHRPHPDESNRSLASKVVESLPVEVAPGHHVLVDREAVQLLRYAEHQMHRLFIGMERRRPLRLGPALKSRFELYMEDLEECIIALPRHEAMPGEAPWPGVGYPRPD